MASTNNTYGSGRQQQVVVESGPTERDNDNYSNEDEEDDVCCAKCQDRPEDVLILTCDHNLCLACASNNLHEQQTMHQNTFQTVICEFCQSATVLDPDSAVALLEMQHDIQEQDDQSQFQQQQMDGGNTADFNRRATGRNPSSSLPTASAQMSGGPNRTGMGPRQTHASINNPTLDRSYQRNMRELCKDHPEEEVQYFCFDCNTAPICPECVIHGAHQGHEVSLLKKAYPKIVKEMEELAIQVNTKIDDLALQDQRIESRRRDIGEQNHAAKQYMANAFEELRQRIDQKERSFMKQSDNQALELIAELDGATRLIKGRIDHLGDAVGKIQSQVKHEDDVSLSTFYANNYENMKRTCLMDSDLPMLKEIPQKVSFQAKLDMTSLDQFLKDMESVQICLENMTGDPAEQDAIDQQLLQQRHNSSNGNRQQVNRQMVNTGGVARRQPHSSLAQHEKLSTMGENFTDNASLQGGHLTNDPSAKSVFQVAYSQKSEKQNAQRSNPLQVSVAQTMNQLKRQKMQQAQNFFQGRQQAMPRGNVTKVMGDNSDNEEPEF